MMDCWISGLLEYKKFIHPVLPHSNIPLVNGGICMRLTVNGEKHKLSGNTSIPALLTELGATPEHSALTVNGDIIFSKDWKTFELHEGDSIEVLTFVGGG
jgi:thiamine biosynthesis protein ThiS